MYKKPEWLRGTNGSVPNWSALNRLKLKNMRDYFSYVAATDECLMAEIQQLPEISQHTGAIQGGVISLGCETVACMAASLCVPDNHIVVATGIHTHYIMPSIETVTLTTRCVHSGKRSAVWHVAVSDKSGKTTATSTVDMAVLRRR